MVVQRQVVDGRLRKLEEVVSRLEELAETPFSSAGFRDAWAVERGLQVGAEILLDIGNHILSTHFGTSAEGYEDILAQLRARKVLSEDLFERLQGLGGFRNVLVHGYLRLDPARVEAALQAAPRDFNDFSLAVREWLRREVGPA